MATNNDDPIGNHMPTFKSSSLRVDVSTAANNCQLEVPRPEGDFREGPLAKRYSGFYATKLNLRESISSADADDRKLWPRNG